MKEKISRKEVEKVADLARLYLDEKEKQVMTKQLNAILEYVEKLNEVNTENIEPLAHIIDVSNAFRQDEVIHDFTRDEALQNAPSEAKGCFKVPKIIE